MKEIHLPKNSIIVFDKGDKNYNQCERFLTEGITRQNSRTTVEVIENLVVDKQQKLVGVKQDELIVLEYNKQKTDKTSCEVNSL